MDHPSIKRCYFLSVLNAWAAAFFFLFFQINKSGPFRGINPFAADPYDAVGSIAIQAALLLGILTYARALRLLEDPGQAAKTRFILRGNTLVLSAIWVTLIADAVAMILHSIELSGWGMVLAAELVLMIGFTAACTAAFAIISRSVQIPVPPRELTPADAIDDLWALVRVPVVKIKRVLPTAFVEWVAGFCSDRLFAHAGWLDPRRHPWRFACGLGLFAGAVLLLAQLREGLPPSLMAGLLIAGIFLSVEFIATLLGFAVLGVYLGLRPE